MPTYDLTDEATLRAFSRIKRNDVETTIRIALLISAMSRAVCRYTQREFLGKTLGAGFDLAATTTKLFTYDGRGYLSLAPYEARSVTSVMVEGVALEPQLAGDQIGTGRYRAEPRQKTTEDTYLYLVLPPHTRSDALVEVTATWGVSELPEDVELACLHAVADAFGNPEGASQRALGDGLTLSEGADEHGGSLPRASRALLAPLMRRA